jgi:metallo-beta-lactamase class B
LGNLSDAVIPEWDKTVMRLIDQYINVKIVIPGHGNFGGKELLFHTVDLVEKYKNKSK